MRRSLSTFLLPLCLAAQAPPPPPPSYVLSAEEKNLLITRATELGKRISLIRAGSHDAGLLVDVEVYHKAISYALRYPEEFYRKDYLTHAHTALDHGLARAKALEAGTADWGRAKGRIARAYRSRVDGSLQPYLVVVPASYEAARPMRLDVVLHGRNATISEASFLATQPVAKPQVPYTDRLELHVYGRGNNAYRWAGETDVYEALASVRGRYNVDPERIVLRGFSMGGAGTWHIGLHNPAAWAGIEAGAGFNETITYAKQTKVPEWAAKTLHIYDVYEWARNAGLVPTVGYGGDQDPQLKASVNVQDQLKSEGVRLERALFLVGPNIGHRFHPESKKQSDAFLDASLPRKTPDTVDFLTYTARYNRAAWVTVEGMEEHYARAEVKARRTGAGVEAVTKNVARLKLDGTGPFVVDGQKLASGHAEKKNGKWGPAGAERGLRKRHGLQGPIDDAFMDSFVVVKGTAAPWNPAAGAQATNRAETFTANFAKWMRGDVREADDTAVTAAMARENHLVLIGDPGSNRYLARIASKLPVKWTREAIEIGGRNFAAADHLLVMIYPNPAEPSRYVVLNSGHSFGETEFKGTNALLYPRLGDWAVLNTKGEVVTAGLFDDRWRLGGR